MEAGLGAHFGEDALEFARVGLNLGGRLARHAPVLARIPASSVLDLSFLFNGSRSTKLGTLRYTMICEMLIA